MEEKRKFMRFSLFLEGRFELNEGVKTDTRLKILDCSREGMRIRFLQSVFLETSIVKITFDLSGRHNPLSVQGAVKWMKLVGRDWELGMKFDKIDPTDKSEILDYAYTRWRKDIKG